MDFIFIGESSSPPTEKYFDLFDYSNVACSLRQLDNASDKCILVRRDSDNATQSIGWDFDGLIDVVSLDNFVGAGNNGYVVTWYGQGTALDYTSPSDITQPKIVENGVTMTDPANGLPAIYFSETINEQTLVSSAIPDTGEISFFFVHNSNTILGQYYFSSAGQFKGVIFESYYNQSSGIKRTRMRNPVSGIITTQVYPNVADLEQVSMLSKQNTIGGNSIYKNTFHQITTDSGSMSTSGAIISSISGNPTSTTDTVFAQPIDGYVQEMIVYDVYKWASRLSIEQNMMDYWNVPYDAPTPGPG